MTTQKKPQAYRKTGNEKLTPEFWRDVYRANQQAKFDNSLNLRELLVEVGQRHELSHDELVKNGIIEAPAQHPLSREARAPGGQARQKKQK
ncbi:MAG TPA: hypothetical protein VMJ93_14630 [Verrucomicrobiae bacterium]|nr:hypothetical protein [Verrucomicrobiae bacterium]